MLTCHWCGEDIEPGKQCQDVAVVGASRSSVVGLWWDQWYTGRTVHEAYVWSCRRCWWARRPGRRPVPPWPRWVWWAGYAFVTAVLALTLAALLLRPGAFH